MAYFIPLTCLYNMSIYYRVQQRINPQDRAGNKKYYLIQRSLDYIGRKELLENMCHNTSLTPQEASTALDYFFKSVPMFLKLGFTVGLHNTPIVKYQEAEVDYPKPKSQKYSKDFIMWGRYESGGIY